MPGPTIPGATPETPDAPVETQVVEVQGEVAVRLISNVLRRAFVAGEGVRLAATAPRGCEPQLHVDERTLGPVSVDSDGGFHIDVPTRDLAAGRHVGEIVCAATSALLLRTVFWVAAPQSSSNLFVVGLTSLLVLCALGWVCLRTLAGSSVTAKAATGPASD